MPDHVHLFIQAPLTIAPNRIIAGIKGYTSRILCQEFLELKSRLPTLWTRSLFVSTHGHVSSETIRRYVVEQKCSGCGEMVQKPLSERAHICPRCGLILDRDVNAASNILTLGLEQALREAEPLLIHKRISKFSLGSEKPTSFRRG
jgi:predicted RNA-binding Zn-ribbon protein involved in translation (DUF1610 family)